MAAAEAPERADDGEQPRCPWCGNRVEPQREGLTFPPGIFERRSRSLRRRAADASPGASVNRQEAMDEFYWLTGPAVVAVVARGRAMLRSLAWTNVHGEPAVRAFRQALGRLDELATPDQRPVTEIRITGKED